MDLLRLVNSEYPLENEYTPERLVQIRGSKVCIYKEVVWAFRRLNVRLILCGLEPLVVISGYRPFAYQENLFNKKTNYFITQGMTLLEAEEAAGHIVARPGTSEHQTGLAIDVTTRKMGALEDPLITAFGKCPTGAWLAKNSYREGFVLRYPEHKVALTHITYEPWHYRYVGKKAAYAMHKKHLCLEEYVLMHRG